MRLSRSSASLFSGSTYQPKLSPHQSRHILRSHCDMNQVPNDVHSRCVHLLDPMDAVGRYNETVIRHFRKAATVLAREGYRQHLFFAGCLQRINQIGRFTAGAEYHRHVARHAQPPELIHEAPREVKVVTDGRHRSDIGHERNHWKRRPLFDDWVIKLHTHVERIAQAPTIAHYEKSATSLKTLRHRTRHYFERFGVFREEFLLHFYALATFADDFVAKAFRRLVNRSGDLMRRAHVSTIALEGNGKMRGIGALIR